MLARNARVELNRPWPGGAIWWHMSTLAYAMACYLTALSHYLTQCRLIISNAWRFKKNYFSHESLKETYKFAYVIFHSQPPLSRGQQDNGENIRTSAESTAIICPRACCKWPLYDQLLITNSINWWTHQFTFFVIFQELIMNIVYFITKGGPQRVTYNTSKTGTHVMLQYITNKWVIRHRILIRLIGSY